MEKFLEATAEHRWAVAWRLGVLYGLRRSEVLALRWNDVDAEASTLRIDESLVPTNEGGASWGNAKNERSRRTIPLDDSTMRVLQSRRAAQAAEQLAAGPEWDDTDLIITTRQGGLVLPRSYDRAMERIVKATSLPRLTSHGLRHTAATHMVQNAADLGELRAIADLLGHSPEMLLNIYAHALPDKRESIVARLGNRTPRT